MFNSQKLFIFVCIAFLTVSLVYCSSPEAFYLKHIKDGKYVGINGKKFAHQSGLVLGPKDPDDETQLFVYDNIRNQFKFFKNEIYIIDYTIADGFIKSYKYNNYETKYDLPSYLKMSEKVPVQWSYSDDTKNIKLTKASSTVGLRLNPENNPNFNFILDTKDLAQFEKEYYNSTEKSTSSDPPAAPIFTSPISTSTTISPVISPPVQPTSSFALDTSITYKITVGGANQYLRKEKDANIAKIVSDESQATEFRFTKKANEQYVIADLNGHFMARCRGCSDGIRNNAGDSVTFHVREGNPGYAMWIIPGAEEPKEEDLTKCENVVPDNETSSSGGSAVKESPPVKITVLDLKTGLKIRGTTLSFADSSEQGADVVFVPVLKKN